MSDGLRGQRRGAKRKKPPDPPTHNKKLKRGDNMEEKKKRKTYTSSAVKERYNKKHYDRITFHCPKGANEMLKKAASVAGMTKSAYIRTLVIQDAQKRGLTDVVEVFGGGGF